MRTFNIWFIIFLLFSGAIAFAQDDEDCNTGLDIHIANDISGSVDSTEFEQSKDFIAQIGFSFANSLGTTDEETRLSISNWSSGDGQFLEYNFPIAGQNYTSELSDIISFAESPRPFTGGTDIYTALLKAFEWVNQNPIPNRNVPKVIILLTDAFCSQIPADLTTLASQIKAQGIVIILLAIDEASTCDELTGTNVASPDGYFGAATYDLLQQNALTLIQGITEVGCNSDPPSLSNAFDLDIQLDNYELVNCNPGPPSGSVDVTVTNIDLLNPFNDVLKISFYDGDPALPGTQFLFTEDLGNLTIASNGGDFTTTITSPVFLSAPQIYAIINYDGSLPGNEVPISFSDLADQIEVDTEDEIANNISLPIDRIDEDQCAEFASINVQVSTTGVGCDDQVFYTVQICNDGTADAITSFTDITAIAPSSFNLVQTNLIGANPYISDFGIGPEQIVSENVNLDLRDLFAADLDGDGDQDVISANVVDEKIGWYANDGTGVFGAYQPITSNMGTARVIHADDLDNDGDLDVIAAGDFPNEIVWFENDGTGNFAAQQIISSSLNLPESIFTSDLDNDGDMDVLATFFNVDTVAWYENDGLGNFGPQLIISNTADGARSATTADFDGDGDQDVISISDEDEKIAWYENDGTGNFGPEQFIAFSLSTEEEVHTADLNGDGAIDFVANGANQVTWFQNDGTGNFGAEQIITNTANSAQSISLVDFDGDGDIDVISSSGTSTPNSKITWYENDGNGVFATEVFVTGAINNPRTVIGADMDTDGDPDVLSLSLSEDKIVWYENLIVTKLPFDTCVTYEYEYIVTGTPAGDYNYAVDVEAIAEAGINPFVLFTPDMDFSYNGISGLNGFNGDNNTDDDLSYDGTTDECVEGEQVLVDVAMTGEGNCPGDFSTATITINNQSGLTQFNTLLTLDLTGTDALFNGEPFNLTNGLDIAEPNIFDPNYPNVPNAISQQNGIQTLDIFELPGGVSTFSVNIFIGTTVTGLNVQVSQLPLDFNTNGIASGFNSITPSSVPVITGICPDDVSIDDTTISLNFSVTNATSFSWSSGTSGTFTNNASAVTDYIINDQDKANGYVDLSLQATSAGGCLEIINCRVNIIGGVFDYGDAPISFDFNQNSVPVAAGALINADIHFGANVPDDEATNQPTADASGDGEDEDAISIFLYENPIPGNIFTIDIDVTNNSAQDAYVYGYLDWNDDGDYILDPEEKSSLITIPAGSGTLTYPLEISTPNDFLPTNQGKYLRLRISTDELAANVPYGTAANGEVEDYIIFLNEEGCASIQNDIVDPTPLAICQALTTGDINNETAFFDLTQKIDEITQTNTDFEVTFYESQTDLDNDLPINPADNYVNISNPQTLEVKVFDTITGCEAFTQLTLIIDETPVLPNPIENLESCADDGSNGIASFNLNLVTESIIGGDINFNATYHTTQLDADTGANPIPTPATYDNTSSPQTIWVRVENVNNTTCFAVGTFQLLVTDSAPINTNIDPFIACDDDNDGFFNNFDLSLITDQINFGNPDVVVTYHLTSSDAQNGVGVLSSPYANVVESVQTIYFRAVDTNNGCEQFGDFELQVFDSPLLTPIEDILIGCDDDNDGFLLFDLTQVETEVLGDLDPTNLVITYHLSLANAQTGDSPIIDPENYQNASSPQTIWIRVTDSASPVGCFDIETFEIIVEPTPDIVNPEPLEVCDDEESGDLSDEIASFDLNDKIAEITQGNNELNVEFFESQADLDSDNPINPIDSYVNIANPQTLEVKVTSGTNGCSSFTTLTLVVNPVPSMAPELEPLEICDPDNDGFAEFDLEEAIIDILNNEPDVSITFHLTLADAELGANPIDTSSPFGTSNPDQQTIYVRAENTGPNGDDGTGCFDTRPLDLIVIPSPDIEELEDLSRCDDESPNGFASFDLTQNTPLALGNQDAVDNLVTYHETQLDAEQGTNPIAVPSNYTNISNPQIIYVRIENIVTGCIDLFDTTDDVNNTFTLTVEPLPIVNTPSVLEVCDDDDNPNPFPQTTFDLTVKEPEIVGQASVPSNLQFSYYESQADLDADNAIADPTAYVNTSQPQSIYIKVVNNATQNDCFDTTVLTISVLPLPSPSETDPDVLRLIGCDGDNDGVANQPFDLTDSGVLISGSENVDLSYYLTESGANTQDANDLIATPDAYVNQPSFNLIDENGNPTNTQVIYVRVDNGVAGNFCYVIVPFELEVNQAPELNPNGDPFAYTLCEDDDANPGIATLFSIQDITNNLWDFTNGSSDVIIPLLDPNVSPAQNIDDFAVTYHFTEQDALTGLNAIAAGESVSDGDILFIRVINRETFCFNTGAIGQVQMVIQPRPAIAADNPGNIVICAEDINSPSVGTVDLTGQDEAVNPGAPANTLVIYYAGMMDYNNGTPIEDPTNFTTTQSPQTIIAEVINTETLCESSSFVSFEVIVDPLPMVDISGFDGLLVCFDSAGNLVNNDISPPTIDTGLSEDIYDFVWAVDGVPLPNVSSSIEAVLPGIYTVTVTNTQTGCEASSSAEIIESSPPEFVVRVLTPSFSGSHVVEVSDIMGSGDFEFQLDDGEWISLAPGQTTLVFSNIAQGTHVITGRDSGGCGEIEVAFTLIDFPPFFTPNQDGFNDTWNITGLTDQRNAKIYIFDRYGKLLKQISPAGEGWDGTYNGKNMPAQDYWFRVEFEEPTTEAPSIFKAHFTLKR